MRSPADPQGVLLEHRLCIAGLRVALHLPPQWEPLGPRFCPFVDADDSQPPHLKFRPAPESPDATARWRFRRSDTMSVWEGADGWVNLALAQAHPAPLDVEMGVDTALRVAMARYLSTREGLLLHASGWLKDGRSAVFFGVHAAGKSTTVKAAPPGEYLCDDGIIVRREGGVWKAYGTPFRGTDGRPGGPAGAPMHGLYALVQDRDRSVVEPLPPAEAVQRLMRCVMLHEEGREELAGVLRSVTALVSAGLVSTLRLGLGTNPWSVIAPPR